MINNEYKYSDLTSKVIGCAMRVHSTLGNGFQEVIYQRALAIEFQIAEIVFSREFDRDSSTKGKCQFFISSSKLELDVLIF